MLVIVCKVLSDPLIEDAEVCWVQIWFWVLIFGSLILWVLLQTLVMRKYDFSSIRMLKAMVC